MRAFPDDVKGAVESFGTVVLRTDFSDEPGWLATLDALNEVPADWEGGDPEIFVIEDPAWSGATPADVLDAVRADEYLTDYLSMLVVADKETMAGEDHLLLVVTTTSPDDEDYDEVVAFGREFRCLPVETHAVAVNLGIGNMGFEEFSEAAASSPGGVFRGFAD